MPKIRDYEMERFKSYVAVLVTGLLLGVATAGFAGPPDVQTQGEAIYLADNLDEADNLGWCIDTVGRGLNEKLHAHSCKPQGGDVQFRYDAEARQIQSVAFVGKCMTLANPDDPAVPFDLLDCVTNDQAQQFEFDAGTGLIRPDTSIDRCVVVGAESRSAGPFMSRDLALATCGSVPPELSNWAYQSE